MARGTIGKRFNTAAGLFLIAGAVIGIYVLAKAARSGKVEEIISSIGGSLGAGGVGTNAPIGGAQFGPNSSPLASSPAITAAAATRAPMYPTAGELAREPAGGWSAPPMFQQIAADVVRDVSGGKIGGVNPANRLLGFVNPITGELSQDPGTGGVAMWA